MDRGTRNRRAGRESRWTCPRCGGAVLATGPTEREPVRCEGCSARYRHPRMAILLSLALPGLGSIRQGHRIWGGLLLVLGFAAFLWTAWRILLHVQTVVNSDHPRLLQLLAEAGTGIALVIGIYCVDLLAVWLRRGKLVDL